MFPWNLNIPNRVKFPSVQQIFTFFSLYDSALYYEFSHVLLDSREIYSQYCLLILDRSKLQRDSILSFKKQNKIISMLLYLEYRRIPQFTPYQIACSLLTQLKASCETQKKIIKKTKDKQFLEKRLEMVSKKIDILEENENKIENQYIKVKGLKKSWVPKK